MRSRSKRLFIVLLHLVGVSTNLPRRNDSHLGIVGVNPMAILLERLTLEDYEDGLDGLLRASNENTTSLLAEPFWLQDDVDGKCFGPAGFSECGDATLWLLRRSPPPPRRLLTRLLQNNKREWGYALQLVDMAGPILSPPEQQQQQQVEEPLSNRRKSRECLVASRTGSSLGLGSCSSRERAWTWRINGKGVLYQEPASPLATRRRQPLCVARSSQNGALLHPCAQQDADQEREPARRVRFSLVRYQIATAPTDVLTPSTTTTATTSRVDDKGQRLQPDQPPTQEQQPQQTLDTTISPVAEHLPTRLDLAHSHATEPAMHAELKPPSRLLFTPLGIVSIPVQESKGPGPSVLKGAIPNLMATSSHRRAEHDALVSSSSSSPPPSSIVTTTPTLAHSLPTKIRKIPIHPYIAASKHEIWVDPQTGLEYPTDLCRYLGHDRKESGRHTLVGVGQYTRTVFNIKVYGVGLYVSKRDVLADASFQKYAHLNAEELRQDPSFYELLRLMASTMDNQGGSFDRTLLIKLNMQLSTDTMRSSLHAEWKMLTDERKSLLINSSLKARPADENMLKKIQSDDNPSNCSCGQVAPEEYNADTECCARGTELVFTWRKNGDLEVRLDGRLIDTFPRPDVAKGIFYEYLRYDDPISPDFLGRVVDGFPFLLAPLAQVKGVLMVHPSAVPAQQKHEDSGFMMHGIAGLAEMVSLQTDSFTEWVQHGAAEMAGHVGNAAKSVAANARGVGEEMDRRRSQLWTQLSALPESGMNFVNSRLHPRRRSVSTTMPSFEEDFRLKFAREVPRMKYAPRGRIFRFPLTRWLGEEEEKLPDEIEPMIHPPTTFARNICLTMVHLYLLLLLIVSFPGSENTRTRLVVRRRRESPSSDTDSDTTLECSPRKSEPPMTWDDGQCVMSETRRKAPRRLLPLPRGSIRASEEHPRARQEIQCRSVKSRGSSDESASIKKSLSYFL